MDNLSELQTEQSNPASRDIDLKPVLEVLKIINDEDKKVPFAVEAALPDIAAVVEMTVAAFKKGGRLFYVGAGTSGRLGVLDASECPPTFGVGRDMVQGVIAGGLDALVRSIEWAEDDENAGREALLERRFCEKDVVIGITASGQAPYVIGAMKLGMEIGAGVGAIGCNKNSQTFNHAHHSIFVDVGPEIVAGSTRMKSGTAQKLVLNMITTAAMIRLGKVYNNLMVDLVPVNKKLIERSKRLIMTATDCDRETAEKAFEESDRHPKTAIVAVLLDVSAIKARELLSQSEGRIGLAVKNFHRNDA
ncbi:MAG: N-acetylmuramic acid 6-phosphate etherase [Spirochaetales bacterium]|nr:N-acetylmuramic acid 6-phosphate etherase [Spirochaetales bacterium]